MAGVASITSSLVAYMLRKTARAKHNAQRRGATVADQRFRQWRGECRTHFGEKSLFGDGDGASAS